MASKEVVEKLSKDSNIFKRREYGLWKNMLEICYNESNSKYKSFGGKGIEVCQLWRETKGSRGYLHFIGDMGFAPDKNHIIKRIDPKKDFKPSNCVWADKSGYTMPSNTGYIKVTIKDDGIFSHLK